MSTMAGKVVLITGGARGIGAGTARALALAGARVVLTDVDSGPLEQLVDEIGDDRVLGIVADVCELAQMESAAEQALERFGRIDVVIANAGIASYGSVLAVDPGTFRRVLDVNVLGVFHTARATLPALIASHGYLLVVSSLAAFAAAPGLAAYNASKAGAEHLANAIRLEVAHHGVDVGCAHMSWIDTPLVQDVKRDLGAFRRMLDRLPFPLGRTTSVEACVQAFVDGVERRKRTVYCPRWVRVAGLGRNVVNSAVGNAPVLRFVPEILPEMDAEVAALGRSTSARNIATDNATSKDH